MTATPSTGMYEQEFADFAYGILKEFGLGHWRIVVTWNMLDKKGRIPSSIFETYSTLGQCDYIGRTLRFSPRLILHMSHDQIYQTLLHEIAHVLCPGDGHGHKWKAKMKELGALPATKGFQVTKPLWYPECHSCGVLDRTKVYSRYVSNKKLSCTVCGYTGPCNWTGGRETVAEVK